MLNYLAVFGLGMVVGSVATVTFVVVSLWRFHKQAERGMR